MKLPRKKVFVPRGKVVDGKFKFEIGFKKLLEGNCFEIDSEFQIYRNEKKFAMSEPEKHCLFNRFDSKIKFIVIDEIIDRLVDEHPEYFSYEDNVLDCKLTNEKLVFDENMVMRGKYINSLDSLASQIQEDIAVLSYSGKNWVSALHICLPSYFDPRNVIGKDFTALHKPVPDFNDIGDHNKIVQAMINYGPFVRYNSSFVSDNRLNHHPIPPAWLNKPDKLKWKGKDFRSENELYLRVERQITIPLSEIESSIFLIRPYIYPLSILNKEDKIRLARELNSISELVLEYKGFREGKDFILKSLLQ